MQRRKSLSRNEVLSVMRLMTEVAGHRGLPQVQRDLVATWVSRHIGATSGAVFTGVGWRVGQVPQTLNVRLLDGGDEVFGRYVREVILAKPGYTQQDPYVAPSMRSAGPVGLIDQRAVLGATQDLLRYGPYADWHRDAVMRDGMLAWRRIDQTSPDAIVGVSMHRVESDRSFNAIHRQMLRLLVTELGRLALTRSYDMPELSQAPQHTADLIAGLSHRHKQMLSLLLAGSTPGRVAMEMGLSVHTVRDYIKQLYRHFGVHGREELVALIHADLGQDRG